jgi:protein regulator of cytokinesis 1
MEASLDDPKPRRNQDEDQLVITYPLVRCLQALKEKHGQVSRLHKERFEQVKSAFPSLEYSTFNH